MNAEEAVDRVIRTSLLEVAIGQRNIAGPVSLSTEHGERLDAALQPPSRMGVALSVTPLVSQGRLGCLSESIPNLV